MINPPGFTRNTSPHTSSSEPARISPIFNNTWRWYLQTSNLSHSASIHPTMSSSLLTHSVVRRTNTKHGVVWWGQSHTGLYSTGDICQKEFAFLFPISFYSNTFSIFYLNKDFPFFLPSSFPPFFFTSLLLPASFSSFLSHPNSEVSKPKYALKDPTKTVYYFLPAILLLSWYFLSWWQ